MTTCVSGGYSHDFPIEDEVGAYCPRHGVSLVWNAPPLTEDDLAPGTDLTRIQRPALDPAPLPTIPQQQDH